MCVQFSIDVVESEYCIQPAAAIVLYSQLVTMKNPLSVGVIKSVGQPLCLQQLVALYVEEQRLASSEYRLLQIIVSIYKHCYSLQLPVLLPESIQVDGAPDAGPLAADDDDGGAVDGEEGRGAGPAVDAVPHRLVHVLPGGGLAAGLPQAHHHAAQQADRRVLRHAPAHAALALVVELKYF